jgi:hypothetical protein
MIRDPIASAFGHTTPTRWVALAESGSSRIAGRKVKVTVETGGEDTKP